jgi:hypothetical protein
MMTRIRGISNAKAKHELGWTPGHPSWRQGFLAIAGGEAGPPIERPRQSADHRS